MDVSADDTVNFAAPGFSNPQVLEVINEFDHVFDLGFQVAGQRPVVSEQHKHPVDNPAEQQRHVITAVAQGIEKHKFLVEHSVKFITM